MKGFSSEKQIKRKKKVLKSQKGLCCICEFPIEEKSWHELMTWEHKIPLCKGGAVGGDNKGVAHRVCNALRGSRDYEDFKNSEVFGYITSCFAEGKSPRKRVIKYIRRTGTYKEGIENIINKQGMTFSMAIENKCKGLIYLLQRKLNL